MRICIVMLILILSPLAAQANAGESACVLMRFTYYSGVSRIGTFVDRDGVIRQHGGGHNRVKMQEKEVVLSVSAEQAARAPKWTPGPDARLPPLSSRRARELAAPWRTGRSPAGPKIDNLSLKSYRCQGDEHWYYLVTFVTFSYIPDVAVLMDGTVIESRTVK